MSTWMTECDAALPEDVRRLLGGEVQRNDLRRGPGRVVEAMEPQTSTQAVHMDKDVVQSKPLPNLHGKWSDGEIVFRFPSVLEAEGVYSMALGDLHPGEVQLVISPESDQYEVHVMPHVAVARPEVIRRLQIASTR